jgi:hypothetical protein
MGLKRREMMSEHCKHCQNGWFDDQRFGQDVECVNGVLIDIDVYHEGWARDTILPVAPCHPGWAAQCAEEDFDNDSLERLEVTLGE